LERLSPKVEERITAIEQRTGLSRQQVLTELQTKVEEVRGDPQFDTDLKLLDYASAILWSRYVSRMQVKNIDVIPVGSEGLRKTRTNKLMSAMYVVARQSNKSTLRRVSLPQVVKDLYRKVNYLSEHGAYRYSVKLGTFGDDANADFGADDRTIFENPIPVKLTPEAFREMFKIPIIKIRDAPRYPSKKTSTGYTIRTDWRCIRGIIAGENRFIRKKSELEGGVYRIIDETTPIETEVLPDGKRIDPTLTVWVPPELMVYERESQCEFYGTVDVDKDGVATMNAFLIIPIRAVEKKEGD